MKNKPQQLQELLVTMHMMVFIIAIFVYSKQSRENEKTLILMDFYKDKILVLKI